MPQWCWYVVAAILWAPFVFVYVTTLIMPPRDMGFRDWWFR